jgi:hypothetical protein
LLLEFGYQYTTYNTNNKQHKQQTTQTTNNTNNKNNKNMPTHNPTITNLVQICKGLYQRKNVTKRELKLGLFGGQA